MQSELHSFAPTFLLKFIHFSNIPAIYWEKVQFCSSVKQMNQETI